MKKSLYLFLLLLPFIITGDNKTYNRQLVINLWNKTVGEITEIKKEFEKVAEKYELTVRLQNIPEMEVKWEKRKK